MSEQVNYRQQWAEGEIEAGTLLDAIDSLQYANFQLVQKFGVAHAEAEALRAENGRLQADRDRANQYANQQALECNKLSTDLEAARGLLRESRKSYTEAIHWEDQQPVMKKIDAFLTAFPVPEVRCQTCDGTGDVHRSDGEWLGECHCVKTEQGERQEPVAWALANSADEIGGFAPIYYTKEGAISWANGRNIFPLYTTPQPGPDVRGLVSADDVRDACANAVSVFAEEVNADQCREVAEYMREVLLAQIARRQAQRQARFTHPIPFSICPQRRAGGFVVSEYIVISLKHTWRRHKAITLWRPDDRGYCWQLDFAGTYDEESVLDKLNYYNSGYDVAVPAALVRELARDVEYDTKERGNCLPNNAATWKRLLAAVIRPTQYQAQPEYRGAPRYKEAA